MQLGFTEERSQEQVAGGGTSIFEGLRSDYSLARHILGHIKVEGVLLSLASPIIKKEAQHSIEPSDS